MTHVVTGVRKRINDAWVLNTFSCAILQNRRIAHEKVFPTLKNLLIVYGIRKENIFYF